MNFLLGLALLGSGASVGYPDCIERDGDELSPVIMWNTYGCAGASSRIDGDVPEKYAQLFIYPFAAHRVADDRRDAGLVVKLHYATDSFTYLNLRNASIVVGGTPALMKTVGISRGGGCNRFYVCNYRIQSQVTFSAEAIAEIRKQSISAPEGFIKMRFFYDDIGDFTYQIPTREIVSVLDASELFSRDQANAGEGDG